MTRTPSELQAEVDALSWYHSIDVAPGVSTPGWFDLRHALPLMPWPDVAGKRCLDVGTWDGFYAFEIERRGAAEVVGVDLPDLAALDYPPAVRADPHFDPSHRGKQERFAGFEYLHEALGSRVRWEGMSIYDLDPSALGLFDVVVVGSLLVHLRDPVRALEAVRRVTRGHLLLADFVYVPLELLPGGRPLFELRGVGRDFQWWLASTNGLERLLRVAGFEVEARSQPFLLRPGASGRDKLPTRWDAKQVAFWAMNWMVAHDGSRGGHLHRAFRARPLF